MQQVVIIVFLFCVGICRGQTLILPILEEAQGIVEGAYYKDLDNELGKFVGTWKYTSGTSSFTITLQKKTMFFESYDNCYKDIIIGEYKYVSNGVEIVNTLNNLNVNYTNQYKYNLSGLVIKDRFTTTAGNRNIELNFIDPARSYLNRGIFVNYIAPSGSVPAKIKVKFTGSMAIPPTDSSPTDIRVPEVDYILTKQP